jgi:hypothetical protein
VVKTIVVERDRNAEFLADLDRAGIKHHTVPGDLSISLAYAVCANFDQATPYDESVKSIERMQTTAHPVSVGAPPHVFVDIAHQNYCPPAPPT